MTYCTTLFNFSIRKHIISQCYLCLITETGLKNYQLNGYFIGRTVYDSDNVTENQLKLVICE